DRSDTDRRGRPRAGRNAGIGIVIRRGEPGAVAAIAKTRQHDVARRGAPGLHLIQAGAMWIEPAEAVPRISPPLTVIDPLSQLIAELAVPGLVDAYIFVRS